jgi:3-demethoxyubiquinol 3-hydroxylase
MLTPFDTLIAAVDDALRTVAAPSVAARPLPMPERSNNNEPLTPADQQSVASMMRVNHTGEVCAQALYSAQAMWAKSPEVRAALLHAADEERDHLAWCNSRLKALNARPSVLNPVWYAGSFALGTLSGIAGDKVSMAFLTETERQVEAHLDGHLQRLPAGDTETAAILKQMRTDEREHGNQGEAFTHDRLPLPVRLAMRAVSKVMTVTAARL